MRAAVFAAVLAMTASPAVAQDAGEDWDYGEDPARKVSVAAVTFENFGVAVRCMEGNLSVVMSGLPVATGDRTLRYRMGDAPEADSRWISGRDSTTAFSVWPRFVGTAMSRGGRLELGVPDGQVVRRVAVDLPASPEAVGRVFRACGQELQPPASDEAPDRENMAGLVWRQSPEIEFPDRARYEVGLAAIVCHVRETGRLRDCTIESEFPEGSGFGRAATFGAHRTGRVAPADGSEGGMEGRRISFVTRYASYNAPVAPPPSRLPGREEVYNPPPGPDETD